MKRIISMLLVFTLLCSGAAMAESNAHWHDKWLPDYQFSGQTKLPAYMNTDSYFPIVKEGEPVTLHLGLVYNDTYTDPDQVKDSWFYTWLAKETGLSFEFTLIPKSALKERKTLLFLEDKLPDIMMGFGMTMTEMVMYGDVDGVLLNMAPYITPDIAPSIARMVETMPDAKKAITTPSGAIYTLPSLNSEINANAGAGTEAMWIKTEWLHAVGLEDYPTTLDGFTEMLYKFKEAYPDSIPLLSTDGQQDARSFFLNAMGYLTATDNDTGSGPALRNGEVVIPAYTETFKEFLRLMNEYYVNGLIPQDYFTLDTTAENALIEAGNFGATNRQGIGNVNRDNMFNRQFWSGYPLTSQWNDKQQIPKKSLVGSIGGVVVSAETEYPEVCVRLLDFWFTEMGSIYQWEGPIHDSEDTLGMTLGHSCTDEWVITYYDVLEGIKESGYFYAYGETNPVGLVFGNRGASLYRPELIKESRQISIEMSGYDVTPLLLREDNNDHWYKLAKSAGIFPYLVEGYPQHIYLDEDTAIKLADLKSVIDPYVDTEVAKFITGLNSLDKFDEFQAQLKALGVEDMLKIYADFYATYAANE